MIKPIWDPPKANDQNPPNLGALSHIEGWEEARPINSSLRVNDLSVLSYLSLKRIESWDTVRPHICR